MDNQKNIGMKLRKAREAAGLTQQPLGDKIGYSSMGISYLEQGIRTIKIEHLEKIAPILNVSVSYFLDPSTTYSYPNTFYGRIKGEMDDERKKEVNQKIADFDKYVDSLLNDKK